MTAVACRLKRAVKTGTKFALRLFDDLLALLVATAVLYVLLAG